MAWQSGMQTVLGSRGYYAKAVSIIDAASYAKCGNAIDVLLVACTNFARESQAVRGTAELTVTGGLIGGASRGAMACFAGKVTRDTYLLWAMAIIS